MDKIVIVKGCAGLGNRLYTIAAAIDYCILTKRRLYVDWSDGIYFEKSQNLFYQYFDLDFPQTNILLQAETNETSVYPSDYPLNEAIKDICKWSKRYPQSGFHGFIQKWLDKTLYHSMMNVLWQHLFPSYYWKYSKDEPSDYFEHGDSLPLYLKQNIVIFADYAPRFTLRSFYKISIKSNFIKQKAFPWINQNLDPSFTLGIHIRAADIIQKKDLSLLYSKLDNFLRKHQIKSIFLATDSLEIQEDMKKKYDIVKTYPKHLPDVKKGGLHHYAMNHQDSTIAIRMFEEALIEILVLQNVKYFFYQSNSTFSEIIRLWRKKKKCFDWTKF